VKQIVLITGGSGGIGSETARRVVARGDRPVLVARDAERVQAVAESIDAPYYVADVLDPDGFAAVVERIETEVGEIDAVVHAVGSITIRPLHALSLEDWRSTLEINATSAFIVVKATVTKMMRRKRGAFVLFSTVAAQRGLQNHEAISAAKSAVEGLVRTAAISYARYNIRFNAVAPALTKTGLSRSLWSNETTLAASVALHPLGRVGEPADPSAAAAFLISQDASWITGQVLGVDGGLGAGSLPPRVVAS
jgi:NAD(P)-dependent dehydrogenase (short-subunit alcohol dehydrogenase family)